MYEVIFLVDGTKVDKSYFVKLLVNDMERALALASMLQKLSTPEVLFGGIIVEPFIKEDHEKKES